MWGGEMALQLGTGNIVPHPDLNIYSNIECVLSREINEMKKLLKE